MAAAKVTDPKIAAMLELERRGELPDSLKNQLQIARQQGVAPPLKGDPNADSLKEARNVLDAVDKAKANIGTFTTGMGGALLGDIPGTAGRDLRGYIDTLKANLSFSNLKQMRQNSPTGAAVGNVSDSDMRLLASTVASLDPNQSADVLRSNLDKVAQNYTSMLKTQGYSEDQINGILPASLKANGAPPSNPADTPPSPAGPIDPQGRGDIAANISPLDRSATTPQQEQAFAAFFAANPKATAEQIRGFATSLGLPGVSNAEQLAEYYNKGGRGFGGFVEPTPEELQAAADKTRGDGGQLSSVVLGAVDAVPFASSIGAALDTAGLTEGRPSIWNSPAGEAFTANRKINDLALRDAQNEHPFSFAGGQAATLIGGQLAAARAVPAIGAALESGSTAAKLAKGAAADATYGALYGAGKNVDDPLLSGARNAVGAALGGTAGRALAGGVGAALAPTGGRLKKLYEQGVSSATPGQRFGGVINWAEQNLGSVPFVGGAVRGARQQARTDFEKGAFDQALSEIGDQLPENIEMGTAPHAYMQNAFNEAYDRARSGMQFVPDEQFQADLAGLSGKLRNGVLSQDEVDRAKAIINNALGTRLANAGGTLSGDAYKAASSEIGTISRQLARSNPNLAEVVRDFGGIVDNAARRNSDPAAVDLLDAADRGYAQAVRIEHAAEARGGDTGRFTPTQFDRAVQKDSGGVRSRAYLRGDALMGDYAEAGKGLVDTVPNSGTAERVASTALLGGAGFVGGVKTLGVPALAALPYIPGVRKLTAAALSPSRPAGVRTLGDYLRNNPQLGAPLGTSLLLPYAGQGQ